MGRLWPPTDKCHPEEKGLGDETKRNGPLEVVLWNSYHSTGVSYAHAKIQMNIISYAWYAPTASRFKWNLWRNLCWNLKNLESGILNIVLFSCFSVFYKFRDA